MTTRRCQHRGLVEALSDGRLGGPERQSVERHVATCAACAAWLRDLETIRQALRTPVAAPTQLQHQRARLALLRAAVAEDQPRRSPHRRGWGIVAVALVAGSAWATTAALRGGLSPAAPLPPSTTTAPPSAPSAAPRVTATAPQPEPAAAEAAKEAPQPVSAAPRVVSAGGAVIAVQAPSAPAPAPAPAPSAPSAPSAPRGAAAPAAEASNPAPASSGPAAPAVTPPSASRDFAEAMVALSSGDFARAAARFEAFTAAYPFDPRSDEAAYLIAIALERAGRTAEARAAARRYLQSRPRGAHRAQAEKMAGATAP